MSAPEYRVPREETERVADALASRFGVDPETVPCDFRAGRIEVPVEQLAELLGVGTKEGAR